MTAILAASQLTLTDLNDAVITGTPPANKQDGLLWIDTSVNPPVLRKWVEQSSELGTPSDGYWEVQSLSLEGLDPDQYNNIVDLQGTLTDMASDSAISQQERLQVQSTLTTITGVKLDSTNTTMPTLSSIDLSQSGEVYSVRLEARNAGLTSSNANYAWVETTYNSLKTYLESVVPLPWDINNTDSSIIYPDDWTTAWTNYYDAVFALKAGIAAKQLQNANDAQLAAQDYSDLAKQYSIRYIRDWLGGSTANSGNHWLEITAMAGSTNRAFGKTVTTSFTGNASTGYPLTRLTDGDTNTSNWTGSFDGQIGYVQIDLGAVYQDINYIQAWHYNADGRMYHKTKLEISDNGADWTTLFDSAVTGEYVETSFGRTTLVNAGNALSQAQSDATTANSALADIANDNKLTPGEKSDLSKDWNAITGEKSYMDAQADIYSITTEKTTYDNAYDTLNTYVPPLISNLTTTSDLGANGGITFRTNFTTYYNAKAALMKKIADMTKTTIDGISIGGRNLALNGDFSSGITKGSSTPPTSWSFYGARTVIYSGQGNANYNTPRTLYIGLDTVDSGIKQTFPLSASTQYTMSFSLGHETLSTYYAKIQFLDATSAVLSTQTFAYDFNKSDTIQAFTFTTPATFTTAVFMAGGVAVTYGGGFLLRLGSVKIEKGNRATDWTPAVEDVNSSISAAQTAANTANGALADIANDNKLTPGEKSATLKDWNEIAGEKSYIDAQADLYSITTEKTTYDNAYIALANYLNGGTTYTAGTPSLLSNIITTDTIDGPTFRQKFSDYYNAKIALLKVVETTAKSTMDSINVGGRNLYLNSSFTGGLFTSWTNLGAVADTSSFDGGGARIDGALATTKYIYQTIDCTKNLELSKATVFTMSADTKLMNYVAGPTNPFISFYVEIRYTGNATVTYLNKTIPATDWQRLSYVFGKPTTITNDIANIAAYVYARDFTGQLYFDKMKLEVGNRATTWTSAPEDVDAAVTKAQGDATTALGVLSDIANDNKLTPGEKSDTLREWNEIAGEKANMDIQADTYAVITDKTAYDNAYQALANYLNGGTTYTSGIPSLLSNLTTTDTIDGPTFRSNFLGYYNAKMTLLKTIASSAKSYTENYANTVAYAMTIDNSKTTYFPFDNNLLSTNGINPSTGSVVTLRKVEGKFGGAASIEESTVNLIANMGVDTFFTSTSGMTLVNDTNYTSAIEANNDSLYGGKVLRVTDNDGNTSTSEYGGVGLITVTGLTNQSYTMSVRYKVVGWTTGTCAVWSHQTGTSLDTPDDYPLPSNTFDGQWHTYVVTKTQNANYDKRTFSIGMNLANLGCTMYVDAIQFEAKPFATSFVNGTRADGKLSYVLPNMPSDFSLLGYRKTILDTSFTHMALTKNSTIFNFYENGVVSTNYKNKWVAYEMTGVGQALKTNDITKYNKPIAKQYFADFSPPSHNVSTQNWGWLFRTFVYSTAAVTVWHRYSADNYGSMRVNNGTMQNIGGWINPATNSNNPDIRIDLVVGWNVIEIAYMDGDVGGGLSLQKNTGGQNLTGPDTGAGFVTSTPLSQVSQVIYMTAELPLEFSSNSVYFNEKSNILIDESMISSRVFTGPEVYAIYNSQTNFDDPMPRVSVPVPSSVTMTLT